MSTKKRDPMKWWREARFGMFIHWGLYAVPAGKYKGKKVGYIGEHIMRAEKIPVAEYEKYTDRFTAEKFNARQWVDLAKAAGMKYLVITAKHHDGFAMYDTKVNDYSIVKRTPFARDPMKDLQRECKKAGIKLCFYYSQDVDWHHPDGTGNVWDFDEKKKDYWRYLKTKAMPQLDELLTKYGPIGLIWCDTPCNSAPEHSKALRKHMKQLQPNCLISGRVGNGEGDYESMGDNQIPAGRVKGDWETPATLNDTWGYKAHDHEWRSTKTLLYLLADLASKG